MFIDIVIFFGGKLETSIEKNTVPCKFCIWDFLHLKTKNDLTLLLALFTSIFFIRTIIK